MSESNNAQLPAWAEYFAPSFERVLHQIELSEGFIFLPVELPDAITTALLADWLTALGQSCRFVELQLVDADGSILEQISAENDASAATIVFAEGTVTSPKYLQTLNQQRDLLATRHARPLVWCGPERFLRLTWQRAPDLWSVAAVPVRLPEVNQGSSTSPRSALTAFLLMAFTATELHHFVSVYFNIDGVDRLPWQASLIEIATALVELFDEQEFINAEFFAAVRRVRPRYSSDINSVAKLWLDRSDTTAAHGDLRAPADDYLLKRLLGVGVPRQMILAPWHDEHVALKRLEQIAAAFHETHHLYRVLLASEIEATGEDDQLMRPTAFKTIAGDASASIATLIIFLNSDRGLLVDLDRKQRASIRSLLDLVEASSRSAAKVSYLLPLMMVAGIGDIPDACRRHRIRMSMVSLDQP